MQIKNIEIRVDDDGFYLSRDIHRSSEKGSSFRPDLFLESGFIKEVFGNFDSLDDIDSSHIKKLGGSKPGLFFSPILSLAYSAWLGVNFFDFFEGVSEDIYKKGWEEGGLDKEKEVSGPNFEQGYKKGLQEGKELLENFVASLPKHPVQSKNISSTSIWDAVYCGELVISDAFQEYLLLRAATYRNMGRCDLLSEFDWESNCYWMTSEFAFSVSSFFKEGSADQLKCLKYIQKMSQYNAWASSIDS